MPSTRTRQGPLAPTRTSAVVGSAGSETTVLNATTELLATPPAGPQPLGARVPGDVGYEREVSPQGVDVLARAQAQVEHRRAGLQLDGAGGEVPAAVERDGACHRARRALPPPRRPRGRSTAHRRRGSPLVRGRLDPPRRARSQETPRAPAHWARGPRCAWGPCGSRARGTTPRAWPPTWRRTAPEARPPAPDRSTARVGRTSRAPATTQAVRRAVLELPGFDGRRAHRGSEIAPLVLECRLDLHLPRPLEHGLAGARSRERRVRAAPHTSSAQGPSPNVTRTRTPSSTGSASTWRRAPEKGSHSSGSPVTPATTISIELAWPAGSKR